MSGGGDERRPGGPGARELNECTIEYMSIRVDFVGGPADGTTRDYPSFSSPLPSLWWQEAGSPDGGAVYRRAVDAPDLHTGAWRYDFSRHTPLIPGPPCQALVVSSRFRLTRDRWPLAPGRWSWTAVLHR
jgi:hypothetical protein